MHAIAIEKGFDSELPDKVYREAEEIKKNGIKVLIMKDVEILGKFSPSPLTQLTQKTLMMQFLFKKYQSTPPIKGGGESKLYEVGVHIADVSYYVKVGSALDEEAKSRGTSVYLVDRTIPMLPEILSNDLCSLVPDKDRLTMSACFTINKNVEVQSEWFGRTVIHSQKRFTYEEAEETIKKSNLPLHRELSILNKVGKKIN